MDGSPFTVVSETMASTVVSRSVIDCWGQSSGHDRPASGLSAHAANQGDDGAANQKSNRRSVLSMQNDLSGSSPVQ